MKNLKKEQLYIGSEAVLSTPGVSDQPVHVGIRPEGFILKEDGPLSCDLVRLEVMGRMLEEARAKGGNAVVAMRFDTSEMGDVWTEICAYGTAVVAVPVTEEAKATARELGYGGV